MSNLPRPYQKFMQDYPEVGKAYEELGNTIAQAGPLDSKTRELIKLGMAAANRSETAVHSHVHRALEAGASGAEIEHTILLSITTLGFPNMMMALSWARAAISAHK